MESSLNPSLPQKAILKKNDNQIWLSSSLTLSRNLEKYHFPAKLEPEQSQQVISLCQESIEKSKQLNKPFFLKSEEASPLDKEYLFEHYLTPQIFMQAHSGEAFVIDESGSFLALINLTDHIELIKIDNKADLEKSLTELFTLESELGTSLKFAYDDKFGFLTGDPGQCGTGLVVRVYLQLPGLIHLNKLDEVIEKYKTDGITFQGLQGNPDDLVGDLLVVCNLYTLGVSEEKILSMIRTFATHMIVEEKSARKQIKEEENAEIKDKISRAYGFLMHSYQAEAVEALNAISLIKLGLDIDWLEGTTTQKLNELFFNSRRAHLFAHYGIEIPSHELLHKRSEFLHDTLGKIKLKF